MKIKYSPVKWNSYAKHAEGVLADTVITYKNATTVTVDGTDYEFPTEYVTFPKVREDTKGVIRLAFRKDGTLYLTIRRYYTKTCKDWDTGDYHDVNG